MTHASKMACGGALALAISAFSVGITSAQPAEDAITRGNRLAYEASMKCYVANGVARSDAQDKGKADLTALYEAKARQSFDIAVKLGGVLGYPGSHINEDFGLAETRELPKMVADVAYFRAAASTCKAMGLM
jgi:hypothetical protein